MKTLTSFEQAVLDKLLAGDDPALAILREQARHASLRSREMTGVGFHCHFDVPDNAERLGHEKFHLGDVNASVSGLAHGAGFVLFVEDGRLAMLEGYSYDEPWPISIDGFQLSYQADPRHLDLPTPR
jgi:hypothetical protein